MCISSGSSVNMVAHCSISWWLKVQTQKSVCSTWTASTVHMDKLCVLFKAETFRGCVFSIGTHSGSTFRSLLVFLFIFKWKSLQVMSPFSSWLRLILLIFRVKLFWFWNQSVVVKVYTLYFIAFQISYCEIWLWTIFVWYICTFLIVQYYLNIDHR